MVRNTISTLFHQLGHGGSDFGHYFAKVQHGNCAGCADCRCAEGPSVEEARQDYQAMLLSRYSATR